MKITAVLGSSRAGSVSKKIAQAFLQAAEDAGHEVTVFDAEAMRLKGCTGCKSCRQNGTLCVIQDDMQKYYRSLETADVLLLSAPNYYGNICGPMITFMNRHYCLKDQEGRSKIKEGIRLFAVFAQGAPENYPKYKDTYNWYLNVFEKLGFQKEAVINAGGNSDVASLCRQAQALANSL